VNLPIYSIPEEFGKQHATQKSDIQRGIEVPLPETYRDRNEDSYPEGSNGQTASP